MGLIGKPSVGKSTYFTAATLKDVEIAEYPFTTIKPNLGVAHVRVKCPHTELGQECSPRTGSCRNGTRFVPVKLHDVAGLVPGAHQGKGLGNQFLDDARQASVLLMVVDASGRTDQEGNPGQGNPVEDVEFVQDEFDRWVAGIVDKMLSKNTGSTEQALMDGLSGLEIKKDDIARAMDQSPPSPGHTLDFARTLRQMGKPMLIVANRADLEGSGKWIEKLKQLDTPVVPASAATEMLLRKAAEGGFVEYTPGAESFKVLKEGSKQQRDALDFARQYLKKHGHTGVQQALDQAVFDLGRMIPVFPVEDKSKWADGSGHVLPDCLLVRGGTTAKEMAFEIHTDIGEGFIKAVDARSGQARGADYVVQSGDILKIHTR